jgi:hypothetical protein
MIRGLPFFIIQNEGSTSWFPSLQVNYGTDYAPFTELIGEDGGLLNPTVVTVADITQIWDYDIDVSWITIVGASLIGTDSMRVMIAPQSSGAQPPRTGHVTFTSDDCANKVITITQQGRAG